MMASLLQTQKSSASPTPNETLQSTNGSAFDLVADAKKPQRFIDNAKLAIDFAAVSLEEVGKLTSKKTQTAQTSLLGDLQPADAACIRWHAKEVRISVEESRDDQGEASREFSEGTPRKSVSLSKSPAMTKEKLQGSSLKTAVELKDQAVEFGVELVETTQRAMEALKLENELNNNTPANVNAEDLLKGEVTNVDLERLDGVPERKDSGKSDNSKSVPNIEG